MFGLAALCITLRDVTFKYKDIIVSILLLLSLLSKESGILFLFVEFLAVYLFQRNRIAKCMMQIITVSCVYLFLRFGIGHVSVSNTINIVPIQALTLTQRILNIPLIIYFYLKTFVYPIQLIIFQTWIVRNISLNNFYIPLCIDVFCLLAILAQGIHIYKKHTPLFKSYLFFSFWFLIGIGMYLQLVPLDDTVADRWFYFPIIGLLGIIGISYQALHLKKETSRLIVTVTMLCLIVLYSIRDIVRETNWSSNQTLLMHDVKINQDSPQIELALGYVYYQEGNNRLAQYHFIRSITLFPNPIAIGDLGTFYMDINKPSESVKAFQNAIAFRSNDSILWMNLALAYYQNHDRKDALIAAQKAYSITPANQYVITNLYYIQQNIPILVR